MRPFRFGVQVASPASRREWIDAARKAEDLGYDILLTADHVTQDTPPPLLPLVTVAAATTRLRVGTFVLNNDLHHPALLARDAAMLDVLSDGRFELGLGAGHMRSEYEAIGLPFDAGADRVGRLEESVSVIKELWRDGEVSFEGRHHRVEGQVLHPQPVHKPSPPVLIGGNGRRILSLAAREADVVGLAGLTAAAGALRLDGFTRAGCRERIDWVKQAAPDRFPQLELNALVQWAEVTADPRAAVARLVDRWRKFGLDVDDVLESPYVLVGDADECAEKLSRIREDLGISYFTVFGDDPRRADGRRAMEEFAPVIERLAGQ